MSLTVSNARDESTFTPVENRLFNRVFFRIYSDLFSK